MEFLSKTAQDTKELAESIAKVLEPGAVLALYGELGAGKTAITRFIVEALGVVARVQSPTFVILRNYRGTDFTVFHADLYRLTSFREAIGIGLEDLFSTPKAITIIEWPELVESILPERTIRIKFEYIDDTIRKIYVHNLY